MQWPDGNELSTVVPFAEGTPGHQQPRGVPSSGALRPASLATLGESRDL